MTSIPTTGGPIEQAISEKLSKAFAPQQLEVINESFMHSVPPGSESHFKVVVVSSLFESIPLVGRHRKVNGVLADELAGGIHALSIEALTPAQWESRGGVTFGSPQCLGGSKTD